MEAYSGRQQWVYVALRFSVHTVQFSNSLSYFLLCLIVWLASKQSREDNSRLKKRDGIHMLGEKPSAGVEIG